MLVQLPLKAQVTTAASSRQGRMLKGRQHLPVQEELQQRPQVCAIGCLRMLTAARAGRRQPQAAGAQHDLHRREEQLQAASVLPQVPATQLALARECCWDR